MKNINYRKLFKFTVLAILISGSIFISLNSLYPEIPPKSAKEDLRIGYVNLNQAKISMDELKMYHSFNCDLWLLAEWNGDNLNQYPEFISPYSKVFELNDSTTFGFLVLAKKDLDISAFEFDKQNQHYVCNYSKIMVRSKTFDLAFLHAPPPVPTCNFETKDYINDALAYLDIENEKSFQMIIGDLNSLPWSSSYKSITKEGFSDLYKSWALFRGTFGASTFIPTFLRIDYAFLRGELKSTRSFRFNLKSSDHCGLVIDVES